MKYKVSHKGEIAQIVKVHGGTATIQPGAEDVVVELAKELPDDMLDHYKARGVTFKKARGSSGNSAEKKKLAEIAKLEAAVEEAEQALDAAESDDAKDEALAVLDAAEKALADAQS